MKELNSKSIEELQTLIEDLKAELFMLRFKNSTGQLDQSHKIELVKKDVARAFTALNAKKDVKEGK
ncbi:50S ribosomal protein L29 [Mycoplasma marinum]